MPLQSPPPIGANVLLRTPDQPEGAAFEVTGFDEQARRVELRAWDEDEPRWYAFADIDAVERPGS